MQRLFFALLLITSLTAVHASLQKAHAYIRAVQENDIWWFRDDTGHNFFSLGVNCVGGCYGHAEAAALAPARKTWMVSLLQEWGFNTAACWSSPSVWNDMYVADQIYLGLILNQHDVFDASFWNGWIVDHLKEEVKPFLGRKNFIGYFLDNEPAWEAQQLFEFYLSLAQDRPGSQAFVTYLTSYYQGSIQQLNAEWGTTYTSFDNIPATHPPQLYPILMQQGILNAWRLEVATTHYRRYSAMVRTLDPDHLILGIRYKGVPDMELFKALTPYFDVNSVNDYDRYGHMNPAYAELYKATGKPLMLTEFSFSGFPHPGQKSALFVDVYAQENRGIGYHKYVLQAARAPFMVGMHWFMWMDYRQQDPSIGGYMPDQNVGLVSNDETVVYEELGQWIKRTNALVDAAHRSAHETTPPPQTLQRRDLQRFVPRVDGDISEWSPELTITPSIVNTLLDRAGVDHTYFFAWDEQYVYVAGDITDFHLESPQADLPWYEGDYLSISLGPMIPSDTRSDYTAAIFISPVGAGADGQQPYATRWRVAEGYDQVTLPVQKRLRPGGYTLEARIPIRELAGLQAVPGTSWKIKLMYQNVNEIYQMQWEGIVTLRP